MCQILKCHLLIMKRKEYHISHQPSATLEIIHFLFSQPNNVLYYEGFLLGLIAQYHNQTIHGPLIFRTLY